ncbi:MAG: nuclear transport factor 2 family protein [Chloroflexota bacterium]
MKQEQSITLVRRYFDELWNNGNMLAAGEILANDFSAAGGAISGLEAAKLYISGYRALFPTIHFTLLSLLADGDTVTACWIVRGADPSSAEDETTANPHSSESGLSIYRVQGGKIMESWLGSDYGGSTQRLGITGSLRKYPRPRFRKRR